MNTFEKLEKLTELAKKDETLRKALLKTRENKEPILSFCALAREAGVELYPGDFGCGRGIFRQPVQEHKRRQPYAV